MIPPMHRRTTTWGLCGCGRSAYEGAVEAYRRSLSLRPHYAATHLNLGYALKDSGRLEEAIAEWEQTLRLAPGDRAAREELMRIGKSFA